MVGALDSGASAPSSSPGWGHRVVLLGKTLHSHGASLHPRVYMGGERKPNGLFGHHAQALLFNTIVTSSATTNV